MEIHGIHAYLLDRMKIKRIKWEEKTKWYENKIAKIERHQPIRLYLQLSQKAHVSYRLSQVGWQRNHRMRTLS